MNARRLGVFTLGVVCLTFLTIWTGHIAVILATILGILLAFLWS